MTRTPDATKASEIAKFMSRVIPWPAAGAPGVINLHWRVKGADGSNKQFWAGKPTQKIDEFMRLLSWAQRKPLITDIYYCLSLQGHVERNNNGAPRVTRSIADALLLRSIWLDIDIKEPPKGYTTLHEALDALAEFVKVVGIAAPSALIGSGGGVHVYWISDEPLTQDAWRPYAEGLKAAAIQHGLRCDAGVTSDAARILRVPGTFNYKSDPPRPVKLLGIQETDYDFSTALSVLPPLAVQSGSRSVVSSDGSWAGRSPAPAFAGLAKESLAEGLEKEDRPLDWAPLVKECSFFRTALETGGKDYDQPMWNLSTLMTTFLENGHALAHRMGNKHQGYSKDSTDALWDRKTNERKSRHLGWPSCNAIQSAGCAACATCKHFGKIKSPLNLALPSARPVQKNIVGQAKTSAINPVVGTTGSKWPGGVDDKTGRPRKGILNTIAALGNAGITCTRDDFRQKEYWSGHADKSFDGEVRDAAITVTRRNIERKFHIYPEITETRDAVTCACHDNKRNPVLDYFDGLKWDGKPRLDKLAHKYLGADDTPLNAAISRKVMCAIIRRAKKPGCKFDHQWVLQGIQGIKKSMFCEDLAVFSDLYTDAGDLSGSIKDQMDIIQGKQIIEFPELAGYSRASREHNKAMLSRKVDRARLSYAHYATDAPRGSISIATTNEGQYLNDPTGERRYWHVAVTRYARDAFLADKDQIYAEAVEREPAENLWLDTPELVTAHDAIVATVKEPNELVDLLADLYGEAWHVNGGDEERISTADIRDMLNMTQADAVRAHNTGRRFADAMKTLGWTKAGGNLRCHKGQQPTTGYTRPLPFGPRNKPKIPVSWA